METLLDYIKNRIRFTVDENEYQKKLMRGPYNDAQIEYAYGIAEAIVLKHNMTKSDHKINTYDVVVSLLAGNRKAINHVVNRIRAQIMLLGGDEYKKVIEYMHQVVSMTFKSSIEYGEFKKSKLIKVGLENGLSDEQIEELHEIILENGKFTRTKLSRFGFLNRLSDEQFQGIERSMLELGEFKKSKLFEIGLENGLSEEQIEEVFENMLIHEDIIKISEDKYKRSW